MEAQAFRDGIADFNKLDAKVIGVSLDDLDSHRKFAAEHKLNFPLVADTKAEIAAKYGVSTKGGFAARTTFVIGSDGKIAKVFPKVRVKGHADEVLAVLKSLPKSK